MGRKTKVAIKENKPECSLYISSVPSSRIRSGFRGASTVEKTTVEYSGVVQHYTIRSRTTPPSNLYSNIAA